MITKFSLKKISFLLVITLLSGLFFISCSDENFTQDEIIQEKEVDNSSILKSGGPAPINYLKDFRCESDIISVIGGCYEFQIRFYYVGGGERILIHSANMSTGDCQSRNANNSCEGSYRGDFIDKDDRINGCIRDYLESDPEVYSTYVEMRNRITSN
ncbi:hypothetical protein [Flavobacterium soli]|uniref:hypothetical protein n=1 Tax=Flavobacterium soli TaxID=344881 RepID=UPI00047E59DC|nr:hypothetical protein [Flavobacterium soli]